MNDVTPAPGALRVWHIPQIPGAAFRVPVASIQEAGLLLRALADYDRFQFHHRIKPDYSNISGLEAWDEEEGEWLEWESEEGERIAAIVSIAVACERSP